MPPPAEPPGGAGSRKAKPGATPKSTAKPCPICGKPAQPATRPFCSPRCRDVDLNRWLTGSYVVPASEDDEEDPE
jgi:uncharacterized protein